MLDAQLLMSIKDIIDHFKSEGAVVKGAPGAFVMSVLILTGLLTFGFGMYEERHYAVLLAEKDATNKKLESAYTLEHQEYEKLEKRATNAESEILSLGSLVNELKTMAVEPTFGASGEVLALRKQLHEFSDRLQLAEVRIPKERVLSPQSIVAIESMLKDVKDKSTSVVIECQKLDKSARAVKEQLRTAFSNAGFRFIEPGFLMDSSPVREVTISFGFVPEDALKKAMNEVYRGLNLTNTVTVPSESTQRRVGIAIGYLE